jgi:hypothetical protein
MLIFAGRYSEASTLRESIIHLTMQRTPEVKSEADIRSAPVTSAANSSASIGRDPSRAASRVTQKFARDTGNCDDPRSFSTTARFSDVSAIR